MANFAIHLRDEGESIYFCREALQQFSAYFAALFHFHEHNCSVTLDAIPGWAVKASLKHIQSAYEQLSGHKQYTSQSYEPEDLYSLIAVSDYFQMESLKNDLTKELILMLEVENFFPTLKFSLWWHLYTIQQACSEFLTANFEEFSRKTQYFRLLPYEMLKNSADSDLISCDEVVILRALIEWLDWNQHSLSEDLVTKLLHTVRYAWISPEHLTNVAKGQQLLAPLLQKGSAYHGLSRDEQKLLAEDKYNRPRLGRLSINKFGCLDQGLRGYQPRRKNLKAMIPFTSSAPDIVCRPKTASWSVRVIRTYQDQSAAESPLSSPIDIRPNALEPDIFSSRVYFSPESEHNSIVLSANSSPRSSQEIEVVGNGMFCPNDGVFYVFHDDDFQDSDTDSP
ncbi:hypothetical protein Ciccas_004968 [Cichlidogyrus casuarinus]|uniref:BACK domain-containing protein n=1 Tax=Cichlidogyrus casuarinus TaxID=1844966 RepID=A0ABD2QA03_9PLAT